MKPLLGFCCALLLLAVSILGFAQGTITLTLKSNTPEHTAMINWLFKNAPKRITDCVNRTKRDDEDIVVVIRKTGQEITIEVPQKAAPSHPYFYMQTNVKNIQLPPIISKKLMGEEDSSH